MKKQHVSYFAEKAKIPNERNPRQTKKHLIEKMTVSTKRSLHRKSP
jgi:hypothetical protein